MTSDKLSSHPLPNPFTMQAPQTSAPSEVMRLPPRVPKRNTLRLQTHTRQFLTLTPNRNPTPQTHTYMPPVKPIAPNMHKRAPTLLQTHTNPSPRNTQSPYHPATLQRLYVMLLTDVVDSSGLS